MKRQELFLKLYGEEFGRNNMKVTIITPEYKAFVGSRQVEEFIETSKSILGVGTCSVKIDTFNIKETEKLSTVELRKRFHEMLESKTSWGRNDLKAEFDKLLIEATNTEVG